MSVKIWILSIGLLQCGLQLTIPYEAQDDKRILCQNRLCTYVLTGKLFLKNALWLWYLQSAMQQIWKAKFPFLCCILMLGGHLLGNFLVRDFQLYLNINAKIICEYFSTITTIKEHQQATHSIHFEVVCFVSQSPWFKHWPTKDFFFLMGLSPHIYSFGNQHFTVT